MASVQSLGLHEPNALPYLIAEGVLPPDPSPESYDWNAYFAPADDDAGLVEEEILSARSCVVWSRCGIIKRVLNLETEGEPVLKAFTTIFETESEANAADGTSSSTITRKIKALVVVLKSQAHILLLSGDTHILPLPFEVDSAFPCPNGFILQRKLSSEETVTDEISFHHDLSTINESQGTLRTNSARPSLQVTSAAQALSARRDNGRRMPRTYSCTEVMSELGLVVCGKSSKPTALDDCSALPVDEEILYISGHDELQTFGAAHLAICIAVTRNTATGKITIWHVSRDVPLAPHRHSRAKDKPRKSETSRRKSSNMYGRAVGATTPVPRGPSKLRESFAGTAPLNAENLLHSSATEQKSFPSDDIAAQFGTAFGEVGVQTRSARRVSSMLARTDLGAGGDRGTFHDLAMGHGVRKSLNRPGQHGESIGSFGDRQSIGRRRSSFPTTTSILSNGTSFLNTPGNLRASLLDPNRGPDNLEDSDHVEGASNLSRELGFFKLTSFFISDEAGTSEASGSFKVLTFRSPNRVGHTYTDLSVCVLDQGVGYISIINIQIEGSVSKDKQQDEKKRNCRMKATKIRRGSGIAGACLVFDTSVVRLLILTKARHGQGSLQLEAPWSAPFRIDLPQLHAMHKSLRFSSPGVADRSRREERHRILPDAEVSILGIHSYGSKGEVLVTDDTLRRHIMSVRLQPNDAVVAEVLMLSNFIFGSDNQDSLQVAFWEVSRWLDTREGSEGAEWMAMIVVLFSLALPFIEDKPSKIGTPQKKKKSGLLRSSSSTAVDLTHFEAMQDVHSRAGFLTQKPSWSWLSATSRPEASPLHFPKHPSKQTMQSLLNDQEASKSSFLRLCIGWAREFIQSPAGEAAIGPEGYLPVSISKNRNMRQTALAKLLVGLHLLNEEKKLNVTSKGSSSFMGAMTPVLAQLGQWLGWEDWTLNPGTYFHDEITGSDRLSLEETKITGLETPGQPFPPPSIFQYLADSIMGQPDELFPMLDLLVEQNATSTRVEGPHPAVLQLTPRTWSLLSFTKALQQSFRPSSALDSMDEIAIKRSMVSTLPDGIASVFLQLLASRKSMLGKRTLRLPLLDPVEVSSIPARLQLLPSHDASKDYHSMSVAALEAETLQRWDASCEADRHTITRLIFQEDRRFQEASKLINQTRPPVVDCNPEPQWSEADLLEAQKELAQFVTRRTLSVASGRGMMHFNARVPLLTERVPIPAFSLQCVMKPRNVSESSQAMTFSADKASFTEDKVCWAFFHNGASAGLMISQDAKGIDTSWILYNKPPELTNRHAGFLLALGLNGHLKTLAKWVAFKYLTPKHTMTSIGLLLGLSASYLGTQDQLVTRMLSVHVTRLLPPGSTELNVSPLTQTTGIMGIGLLYHNSQHRRMSEVMLSELENNDSEEGASEDSILRDEGYRLAAGFSLGLINLGQGQKLHGLHDMSVLERLLAIAVGTKNVNLVHILDRATAGAVMAIAFIFLKTNDESIARKVDIPDTIHQFDYVRPDIFLLRTLARHLILWDSIIPTREFVTASLPDPYRARASLHGIKALHTEDMPFFNILSGILYALGLRFGGSQSPVVRDLLVGYLDQFLRLSRLTCDHYDARVTLNSVRNCLDVLALATALVMAGSGDIIVLRRLRSLHGRTDKDTPFGSHMAAHMAIGTLFLGGGTLTFGTSNLAVAGLCIAFYPLFPGDVLDNKTHLQALRHLWVVAVERRCLVARSSGAVIGGVQGYVRLRNGQEVVVAAPGLLPDFDAISSIKIRGEAYWDINLDFSSAEVLEKIKREGAVNVSLTRKANFDKIPRSELLLEEMNAREEERRMAGNSVPSADKNTAARTHGAGNMTGQGVTDPFEWLFELQSFRKYDYKERDLVLNSLVYLDGSGNGILEGTVVDDRLAFERGIFPEPFNGSRCSSDLEGYVEVEGGGRMEKDRLWQLRLLLEWFDKFDRDDEAIDALEDAEKDIKWGSGMWLKREVVERLRERVWDMAGSTSREALDESNGE